MNVIKDNIDKLHSGGGVDGKNSVDQAVAAADALGSNPKHYERKKKAGCNGGSESAYTASCSGGGRVENDSKITNGKCVDAAAVERSKNNKNCAFSAHKNEKKENGKRCSAMAQQLKHLGKGTTWLAIIMGQVLSVLFCVSVYASVQLVEAHEIRIPNAQNFTFYMVLATVFTTILACRPAERNLFPILRTRGWKYVFVALADAEANYLITKAYQLTTLTSVQFLHCFAIPTVLSLSWLVLRIRFKVPHILGVSISLLGVSCLIWADIEDGKPIGPVKDIFVGDMLCLVGAFLLGFSNIAQEFVVKTFDSVEFLAMVGLFGSFVSGTQAALFEYGEITKMNWSLSSFTRPMTLLITYALAKLTFYVLTTFVIKYSSATLLNLSLLSANFYSLVVSIYLFRTKFHVLYLLSYVLVMTGVITFSIKPTMIASHVYKSLTREVTTTLDLELMASTPTECHNDHRQHEEVCLGGPGSLLITEKSQLLRAHHNNGNSPMLSNESCDVVLQTTATLGRGRKASNIKVISNGASNTIPEETC